MKLFLQNFNWVLFVLSLVTVILFPVSSGLALLWGVIFGLMKWTPHAPFLKSFGKNTLALSIVFLGAGMPLAQLYEYGLKSFAITLTGICFTLLLGRWLTSRMNLDSQIAGLVTVGTAICGGSAIAATGPIMKASSSQMSVALAIVFLLNAVSLFIFPSLGHTLSLSQHDFGLWAALAIHDTSSVVGAGAQYGPEALQVGTQVKLTRALWILPIAPLIPIFFQSSDPSATGSEKSKIPIPWFILGYLAVSAFFSFFSQWTELKSSVEVMGRKGLVLSLFLIGSLFDRKNLSLISGKVIIFAILLWISSAIFSLFLITKGVFS